jgi:hypothetical protein
MNHLDLAHRIKHIGFNLKPNNYRYEDWIWLYNKIKSKISIKYKLEFQYSVTDGC